MTTAKTERAERARRARANGNAKANPPKSAEVVKRNSAEVETTKAAAKREPAKRSTKAARTPEDQHHHDLENAITNMELEHVQCRDFGHSWRPFSARWLPSYNSYESQLICQRCKTDRTRFLSRTGEQLNSAYDYADGYQVKGLGRLTGSDRDVIRLASILAVLPKDTASDD